MNIKLGASAYQISSMYDVRFAPSEDKNTTNKADDCNASVMDQLTISSEGQQMLEENGTKNYYDVGMTKDEFWDNIDRWRSENKKDLEFNEYQNPFVDPDGKIATKTYFESYIGQLIEQEEHIKEYYSDIYEEAMAYESGGLKFIREKYQIEDSTLFEQDMSKDERKMAYNQLYDMIMGSHVALNDPYALADFGGTKTVKQVDEIARQAVKDKIAELVKQYEEGV